jgi:hypothetical protein
MSADTLIDALAADLRPVNRLRAPAVRALGWLAVVMLLAAGLMTVANMHAVMDRMAEAPDLRWAAVGSTLTAIVAGIAAFELSVPGRSAWWVLTPAPSALLWLSASGWGCLRSWDWPGLVPATMNDAMGCVGFITLVSVPLSILLFWMLRRACPLWPGRVAAMAGLAAAAAAASLLTLFHPHDASAVDLIMHVVAVGAVVAVSRAAARWVG